MGMMFRYNLAQCSDYRLCRLGKLTAGEWVTKRITKADPGHWHLHCWEGGGWIYKTRQQCLDKLLEQVNHNYDRLYDEEGNHRS